MIPRASRWKQWDPRPDPFIFWVDLDLSGFQLLTVPQSISGRRESRGHGAE